MKISGDITEIGNPRKFTVNMNDKEYGKKVIDTVANRPLIVSDRKLTHFRFHFIHRNVSLFGHPLYVSEGQIWFNCKFKTRLPYSYRNIRLILLGSTSVGHEISEP